MSKSLFECASFILDVDIYLLFKNGMTGRISYISKKHSKDNNYYFKSYDPKQESKHIIFLGANNLDGFEMSKFFHPADLHGKTLKSLTQINNTVRKFVF